MKIAINIIFWSVAIVISIVGTIIAIVGGAIIGLVATPPAIIQRFIK